MGRQSLVKFEEKIEWRRSRKKKTTPVILKFERCHWISVDPSWLVPRWFNGNAQISKLRAWFFFYGSLFLLTEPKFHSCLTLSSNNSRSKPHTPNKFHIFGIVRTSAFRWTYPGFFFFEQISRNKRFMRKGFFLHFCMTAPRKFSSGRRSDNIDASGLPNSSSESLCPKVFREHMKNVGSFKIGGPSPPRSQLIRIRVQEKCCFEATFLEKILVLTDFDQMLTPP